MDYNSGSKWRRWDLHIHTPGTKKNSQFSGRTIDEQWDNFYKDILNYISSDDENKKVAVLGITDYFSIDNYIKIVSDAVITTKFALILPNIEMRATPVSSQSALNIHLICNPDFVSQLDSKLFCQLKFQHSNGSIFHPIKEDFIKLGKLHKPTADDDEAYKIGVDQFVIELNDLKSLLNTDNDLRENVIVAVSNSSNDGASGIGNPSRPNANSGLTAIRDDIYFFADAIFTSNEKDIKYFIGEKPQCDKNEIIRKYGRLKPCIHGCDAHKNDKILKPDNDMFCWIKADCTFNGLKQIIYEPSERVRISPFNPDSKKDYNVIDKVIINDNRFSSKPIEFNPNLNCFIGGKSTGKSIILNNIVKQIDELQYKQKFKGNEFIIQNLKVYWKDGFISDGNSEKRHVVYIPQTYLNGLSDNQEEKNEIDAIIQDVVLQDAEIANKFNLFKDKLNEESRALDKDIYDLLDSHNLSLSISEELKENGSIETLTKEIDKLNSQRNKLTKTLQINEKEIQQYDILKEKQKSSLINIDTLKKDKEIISKLNVSVKLDDDFPCLSEESYKEVNSFIQKEQDLLSKEWEKSSAEILENIEKEIKTKESELTKIVDDLKQKEKIVEKTENLVLIEKEINSEEEKLKLSMELEKKLTEQKEKFEKLFKTVLNKLSVFDQLHQEFVSCVNNKTAEFDDSIKFIATAPFRLEKFDEKVRNLYNNKKLKNIYKLYDDGMANDVDQELIEKLISPLFNPDGLTYLKSGNSIEEVLRSILSNWYNIVYTVELDNDKVQTMSPGKKALVLLKLLINLADSDCPILIDQPEDDLDNRSIYDELVGFLRKKKNDRQIILVTHNANIVLGSDAEEIIVANQEGTNSPNENFRFEYRSGSIENNSIILDENGLPQKGILNSQGIQGHICEILEGGKEAFNVRKDKYTLV